MKCPLAAIAILLASATPLLAAPALLGNVAQYTLKLDTATGRGGPVGARGRMVIDFREVCDGYTNSQRTILDMTDVDENNTRADSYMSTWESPDGQRMRFQTRDVPEGGAPQISSGEAYGGKLSQVARATFEKPRKAEFDLPPGTIFPTEVIVDLIETAQAGNSTWSGIVFQGNEADTIYDVSAYVGAESTGKFDLDQPLLKGVRSWPVAMSYYKHNDDGIEPDFETSYRLYENGVMTNVLMIYGDFSIRATLASLVPQAKPKC